MQSYYINILRKVRVKIIMYVDIMLYIKISPNENMAYMSIGIPRF